MYNSQPRQSWQILSRTKGGRRLGKNKRSTSFVSSFRSCEHFALILPGPQSLTLCDEKIKPQSLEINELNVGNLQNPDTVVIGGFENVKVLIRALNLHSSIYHLTLLTANISSQKNRSTFLFLCTKRPKQCRGGAVNKQESCSVQGYRSSTGHLVAAHDDDDDDDKHVPGERPYKCHIPECGRAFIQLSNLQQHLRNHESQIERLKNRPFHCNICGKGFATESSLRTHTGKVSLANSIDQR